MFLVVSSVTPGTQVLSESVSGKEGRKFVFLLVPTKLEFTV